MFSGFFLQTNGFLSTTYFGSSLYQYALFFGVLAGAFVVGKIVVFLFGKYFKALASKTDVKFDDMIIEVIEKPLFYLFPLIGLILAFQFLSVDSEFVKASYFNMIQVLGIFWTAWVLIRFVDGLVTFYLKPLASKTDSALDDQIIPVIAKVVKFSILAIVLVTVLSSFGYDVTALIAGLGVGGLAFAFAAKETISDIFGGISIFTSKPFLVGDYIETSGVEGTVEEIGLRYSRLRTPQNRLVTIPNSSVAKNVITNYSKPIPKGIDMTLGLVYSTKPSEIKKAVGIIKNIINETKGCAKDPMVHFNEFAGSSLNIFVRYFIEDKPRWRDIKHEVNMKILEEFNKNKLSFAFPTQTIHLEK